MSDLDKQLLKAALSGNIDAMKATLAQGATPPPDLLYKMVKYPQKEVVEFLIGQKADVNALNGSGEAPLAAARSVALATMLLDAGADPNRGKPRPLVRAAATSQIEVAALLLSRGADPNQGWPLHAAAKFAHDPKLLHMLLEAGADPNAVDDEGLTALEHATEDAMIVALGGTPDHSPKLAELDADELEESYGKKLPREYRDFIESGRYREYNGKQLPLPTYGTSASVWFSRAVDGELELPNLMEDGDDFHEDVSSFVPLASIYVGADHKESQFLVLDVESGRVLMFEHEMGRFIPVAASLKAFLG